MNFKDKGLRRLFVAFLLSSTYVSLASANDPSTSSQSLSEQQLRSFKTVLEREEAIEKSAAHIRSENGPTQAIKDLLEGLEAKKRLSEYRVKWLIVCPAALLVNIGLVYTNLADWFPPLSKAIAPTVGTFFMIIAFSTADKRWNRVFDSEISAALKAYASEADHLLEASEIDAMRAREVDLKHLDEALATIRKLDEAEQRLAAIRDQKKENYAKKHSNQLRVEVVKLQLDELHLQKLLALKQIQLKMIASIRAKLEFGDNRFHGKSRQLCLDLLKGIIGAKGAQAS